MSIASGVGIPLQIDQTTRKRKFGCYARVLVEVDLSGPLPNQLSVEIPNYGFIVDVHYENLPSKWT